MLRENFSFDQEVHQQLELHFQNNDEYDFICIPYTLSNQNYIEFTGLRVAAHIRLTSQFNHQFTPIVFIGPEQPEEVSKLSPLGNILFTSGVFYTNKQDQEILQCQFQWIQDNKPFITSEDYQKFIERINIEPPSNYRSHHSVDNDWALLRWSQYIGYENEIEEVKNNLETGLYFKWLQVKHGAVPEVKETKDFCFSSKGKVLLIDDEAAKGWKAFYYNLFQKSPGIKFKSLDLDFNLVGKDEILKKATETIENWDPDLILLDLRLCDDDFDPDVEPTDMTGYQILNKAKKINEGIQVIITTASNKVWNYQALQKAGADDFLMKSMQSDVEEDISNLKNEIKIAIDRASLLKKVYFHLSKVKRIISNSYLMSNEFINSSDKNLEVAFKLLQSSFSEPKYINYAYLQLFLLLEEYVGLESVCKENGDEVYIICDQEEILVLNGEKSAIKWTSGHYIKDNGNYTRRVDINFKISALLLYRHNCDTSGEKNWTDVYKKRNKKAAHPESGIVTHNELISLIEFIEYVLDENNIQSCNNNSGLRKPSMKDKLNQLKNKYPY
jgi:CheY-like chemotaxis protein